MRRFGYVMVCVMTMGMAIAACIDFPKKLIWNASASTPIGLYSIAPAAAHAVHDGGGVVEQRHSSPVSCRRPHRQAPAAMTPPSRMMRA